MIFSFFRRETHPKIQNGEIPFWIFKFNLNTDNILTKVDLKRIIENKILEEDYGEGEWRAQMNNGKWTKYENFFVSGVYV